MDSDPLPAAYHRKPRHFAPRDLLPKCEHPLCRFTAKAVFRDENGNNLDVCIGHYLKLTTELREAD